MLPVSLYELIYYINYYKTIHTMKNIFQQEKREELKWLKENIDIRNYLESSGYSLDKSRNTRRYQAYFHEGRGDKVYVPMDHRYPVPSYYVNQFDGKDKGTLVDFIMTREKKSLEEARLILRAFNPAGPYPGRGIQEQASSGQKEEKLAGEAAEQQRKHRLVIEKILREKSLKDESYLRSRFLEEDTIRARAFKGKILLNHAPDGTFWVFPLKEVNGNTVVGMSLKNAEGERMLGRRAGLWVSGPTKNTKAPLEQLVITESPIDAMSYYQLHRDRMLKENTVLISTAGNPGKAQLSAVRELIEQQKVGKVILAHDNDKAGAQYNKAYQQLVAEVNAGRKEALIEVKETIPVFKDFNADIRARKFLELRQLEQQEIARPKHLAHMDPLKEEVARLLYEKSYAKLARKEVVKELQESFVEKELDGTRARFSIRELALINNQPKLLQLLEKPGRAEQQALSAPLVKEKEVSQSKELIPSDRPPARQLSVSPDASDQQLEKAYFKTIRSLQLQIKDNPGFREHYKRLELYKNYPHLNEEEVDTYLGLMQRGAVQQQLEVTRGKGKGLAGPEVVV